MKDELSSKFDALIGKYNAAEDRSDRAAENKRTAREEFEDAFRKIVTDVILPAAAEKRETRRPRMVLSGR